MSAKNVAIKISKSINMQRALAYVTATHVREVRLYHEYKESINVGLSELDRLEVILNRNNSAVLTEFGKEVKRAVDSLMAGALEKL